MWFEIFPAFAIVTAAVALPHALAYVLNYVTLGNPYRRLMESRDLRLQYLRDRRLTGDPYKISGLENIPDGDDEECEEKCEEECEENGDGAVEEDCSEVVQEKCEEVCDLE